MTVLRFAFAIWCAGLGSACMQIDPPARASWPALTLGESPPVANLDTACVADYRPGIDYLPQKSSFTRSNQLQVDYGPHYKRVRFSPSVDTREVLEYLLVQCGTPVPPHGPNEQVIQVPIRRLVTGNSAMLGALDELGLVDRLYGSESTRSATVPSVRERIAQGQVHDMWGYGHASIEPIMAVQADVYLSFYSAYPRGNMHPRLWELGVRAVAQADHHEAHPLGRAEWLKLLALLTNREALANERFSQIESDYLRWMEVARTASSRPMVMAGFASGRDRFETFGNHNHRAQLIRDAGGHFALDHDPRSSSLIYADFETVFARASQAPIWLGTIGGQLDTEALIATNALHGWFRAAREGSVYAWDRDYTGAWASPYQDQSMTQPHVQLAEAVRAIHPDLPLPVRLPPRFLRQLP